MKQKLVYYNPGSAPGSPAWLPRPKALQLLEQDLKHCELMQRAGIDVRFPYLGHSR